MVIVSVAVLLFWTVTFCVLFDPLATEPNASGFGVATSPGTRPKASRWWARVSRSISTVRRAPPPDERGLRFPSWPTRTFAYSLGRAFGATVMFLFAEQHRGEREGT